MPPVWPLITTPLEASMYPIPRTTDSAKTTANSGRNQKIGLR